MYSGCTIDLLHNEPQLNQKELYSALSEELIDNNIPIRRNQRISLARTEIPNNSTISNDTIKPIPELRETNSINGGIYGPMTKHRKQGRCRTCFKGISTTICSAFEDKELLNQYFFHQRSSRLCFKTHV